MAFSAPIKNLYTLFFASFVLVGSANAADPFEDGAASADSQFAIGAGEATAGGVGIMISRDSINEYRSGPTPSIQHYVDDEIKEYARKSVTESDPAFREALRRESALLEAGQTAVARAEVIEDWPKYEKAKAAAAETKAALNAGNEKVEALVKTIRSDIQAGKPLPHPVEAFKKWEKGRLLSNKLVTIVGISLIADGARRLGTALTSANQGYSPASAITSTIGKSKVLRPAESSNPAATEAAPTSMTIQ